MIALVILIVIFAFVIYNFYKDYKNWSNVGGSFAEGLTNQSEFVHTQGMSCSGSDNAWIIDSNSSIFPSGCSGYNRQGTKCRYSKSGSTVDQCKTACSNDDNCGGFAINDTTGECYFRKNPLTKTAQTGMSCYAKGAKLASGDSSVQSTSQDNTTSSKTATVTVSGRYGNKTLDNIPCAPGQHIGTESQPHSTNSNCEAKDQCLFELNDKCEAKTLMRDRCKSVRGRFSWSEFGSNVNANDCNVSAVANIAPSAQLPPSTWKSGGSCPVGCKEPICVDGNCKNVTVDNKSYKGCSGTCGNFGGESGCSYDSQCTAENCGVKYFEEGDKTPCKENKRWDNSAWENTQSGGLKSQDQGQRSGVRDPIQPSGEGKWIGAPPTRGVPKQQYGGQQYGTQQQYGGQRQYSGQEFGAQQQRAKPQSYTLFNKQIMTQVLANKNLLPSDIPLGTENQHSYIRIGKNFMHDVARIRNISLPLIKENDYESLGRIVSRVLSRKEKGIVDGRLTGSESQLMNAVNGILSSSQLNSSIIQGNTIPQTSTTSRTTGLMGDKTNAGMGSGDPETGRGMPGLKGKYTDSYKPVDDKVFPRPYDSVWSIFY